MEAYLHDVTLLEDFLEHKALETAKLEDLQHFLRDLVEKGTATRSQARIVSGIKAFYRFLVYDGTLKDDPSLLLDAPKIGLHLPDVLSVPEIEAIINVIDLSTPVNRHGIHPFGNTQYLNSSIHCLNLLNILWINRQILFCHGNVEPRTLVQCPL